MQVNKINSHANFKSKFVPNSILNQAIEKAAKENDRFFLRSMRTILNDGRDDVLELQKRNPYNLDLCVNGEIEDEGHIFLNYYGSVGGDLINKYASKIAGGISYTSKYNNLSSQEKKLISEDVEVIKLLTDNFENGTNFIENIQNSLNNMKQKLDNNVKQELVDMQKSIFG